MKITNHNKGNFTYDAGGNVQYGTITVSQNEWKDIIKYLKYRYHTKTPYFFRDLVINRMGKPYGDKKNLYSLGVTPNELIAKRYKLKLKRQNYQIKVENK